MVITVGVSPTSTHEIRSRRISPGKSDYRERQSMACVGETADILRRLNNAAPVAEIESSSHVGLPEAVAMAGEIVLSDVAIVTMIV